MDTIPTEGTDEKQLPASRGLWPHQSALIVVAHPDDEMIWCGGTILMHPETRWTVITLCRRNDPDRAPKFHNILELLGAYGKMGELDDSPAQDPLPEAEVQAAILTLVGDGAYDLIMTHSVAGEYTRHRRHEEIGAAVLALWDAGRLRSNELWAFAYQDDGPDRTVHAIRAADVFEVLTEEIWKCKRRLVTEAYGFSSDSFEARAALQEEAFWRVRKLDTKKETE